MTTRKNALALALEKGTLKTRPLAAIEADQDKTLEWAEAVAKHLPIKVRRGRPRKGEEPPVSRSVTVRFPEQEAEQILMVADRQRISISEFIRTAAVMAAHVQLLPKKGKAATVKVAASAPRIAVKAPKLKSKG
ncbi:MAG: hypothetical protein P4L36_18095 [Holophaga sp.]|nr:hypothetical protein [Holophaga sp.]